MALDEKDKTDVLNLIDQQLRSSFVKKIGDTPTDNLQLVPKGYLDQQIASVQAGIAGASSSGIFGDASDGVALFDGTSSVAAASIIAANAYALTRSAWYQAVSVFSGITLQPRNNRIFSKTTVINSGSILSNGGVGGTGGNGNNGSAPSSGGQGGGGGLGGASVTGGWFVTLPGANGGDGGSAQPGVANGGNPGGSGIRGTSVLSALINTPSITGAIASVSGGGGGGADAFDGRAGGGYASVATGTQYINRPTTPFYWENAYDLITSSPFVVSVFGALPSSGSGGGGGAGTNATNAAAGGGGGAGGTGGNGGLIMIAAPLIINNGIIQARGGDGGNGGNGGNGDKGGSTAAGGGGGGASGTGGSGGVFFYVTNSYTNNNIVDVSGGSHSSVVGAGGLKSGNGNDGGPGGATTHDGTTGVIFGIVL